MMVAKIDSTNPSPFLEHIAETALALIVAIICATVLAVMDYSGLLDPLEKLIKR